MLQEDFDLSKDKSDFLKILKIRKEKLPLKYFLNLYHLVQDKNNNTLESDLYFEILKYLQKSKKLDFTSQEIKKITKLNLSLEQITSLLKQLENQGLIKTLKQTKIMTKFEIVKNIYQ